MKWFLVVELQYHFYVQDIKYIFIFIILIYIQKWISKCTTKVISLDVKSRYYSIISCYVLLIIINEVNRIP